MDKRLVELVMTMRRVVGLQVQQRSVSITLTTEPRIRFGLITQRSVSFTLD